MHNGRRVFFLPNTVWLAFLLATVWRSKEPLLETVATSPAMVFVATYDLFDL